LLADGWADSVRVEITDGAITRLTPNTRPQPEDTLTDTLLPAPGNLHSHSFQRAMAGMTEFRKAGQDSFWTWRDLMYRFTAQLTPQQVEAIAALVFMEMQEAGFAAVGEFHYLHHQAGGVRYQNIAELSSRIFAAASTTGIGLMHLPVLYSYGGAGAAPLESGQLRFGNAVDSYLELVDAARQGLGSLPPDCGLGLAPHSLRAITPQDLKTVLSAHSGGPVHIHIAEQPQEVADIQASLWARPVEWLLANAEIDKNWCLIHATHMTHEETLAMARTGAVAGLCPITEANLGDGAFNGPAYFGAGGAFGIGSDSNVLISLTEELRMLEYSQRQRDLARNILAVNEGSIGQVLYTGAAKGGAQALGRDAGEISVGKLADLVAINSEAPSLCALSTAQLLDGLVFAAKDTVISDLWSAGRHVVQSGRHIHREQIISTYRAQITRLVASI